MLASCGTAVHYNRRRPRASSASVWLDRTNPQGHPLSLSLHVSVSLTLTGRVVLMDNPQWWLGAVWGRGKTPTSVRAFSAACYKSVTPEKVGTWIRHGDERPVLGNSISCVFVCMYKKQLVELWGTCVPLSCVSWHFLPSAIPHTSDAAVILENQYRC